MLRPLLLAALLLRLVPVPGMLASHCAPEGSVTQAVAGAEHQHHGAQPGSDKPPSEDCTHCPPSDCAKHRSCEVPPVVSCGESTLQGTPVAPVIAATRAPAGHWPSVHTSPPTRPPASLLV